MGSIGPYDEADKLLIALRHRHLSRAGYGLAPVTASDTAIGSPRLYGIDMDQARPFVQEVLDMFATKHYNLLAKAIEDTVIAADSRGDEGLPACMSRFMDVLMDRLEKDNSKFKRFTFIEAALGKANDAREAKKLTTKE